MNIEVSTENTYTESEKIVKQAIDNMEFAMQYLNLEQRKVLAFILTCKWKMNGLMG